MTLDGMPAGLELDIDALNAQLRRRQGGYGRGRRMAIESDRAEILAGVRHGRTTGAPIALLIRNRDWVNWQQTMYVEPEMPEGASGREARGRDAAAARPRRPRRRHQVRPRRHPRRARARQRARDRRRAWRPAAWRVSCSAASASALPAMSRRSATSCCPTDRVVSFAEAHALPDDAPLRCVDAGPAAADDCRHRRGPRGRRHASAARSRSSPPAFRPASARTSSGTASSTAASARR